MGRDCPQVPAPRQWTYTGGLEGVKVTFLLLSFLPFPSSQPAGGTPGSQWTSGHTQVRNFGRAQQPLPSSLYRMTSPLLFLPYFTHLLSFTRSAGPPWSSFA